MQPTPKISVITASYNQGEFLRQNIESVLAQNYPNFEHIIMDGGSTDETLSVVKSYPHLRWISEPDRGQSHAINKAFAMADGEIIAWLNCDDWYAPGVFHAIAAELQNHAVVLGAAQEVDKAGNPKQLVANIERSFWDLFKYWVPYAWLAQPSVFFRRSLLEEVKLSSGQYLDENLYFVMDIDLWLRMAQRAPFNRRIDKVCSYYRIYEDNKTGKHPMAAQRELGRLFRRYSSLISHPERRFSFVIPTSEVNERLKSTVLSLVHQSLPDLEMVFVDCSKDKQSSKALREYSFEIMSSYNFLNARTVGTENVQLMSAIQNGFNQSAGELVCALEPGDLLAPDFCHEACKLFLFDWLGAAMPWKTKPALQAHCMTENKSFNPSAVLGMQFRFPSFVIRKMAFMNLGGFRNLSFPALAVREFLIRLSEGAWMASVENNLSITFAESPHAKAVEDGDRLSSLISAYIISELGHARDKDSFYQVKKTNVGLIISDQVIADSRKVLENAPAEWHAYITHS